MSRVSVSLLAVQGVKVRGDSEANEFDLAKELMSLTSLSPVQSMMQ